MQSIMKVISIIIALLVLAMIFKALDSLSSKRKSDRININDLASIQNGLAHYKDLGD